MKKILLVGKFSDLSYQKVRGAGAGAYTYASSFLGALLELGYDVQVFNCKRNFLFFGARDHDKLSHVHKKVNNFFVNILLKKRALAYNPDIIFFVKAENITHKTIFFLKKIKKSIRVFNFYPDNPFSFWNGNANKNILLSLPVYDCFLIWSKSLVPVLRSAGCPDAYYFPLAYDKRMFEQDIYISSAAQKKYQSDVCFIGTWDAQRELWLTRLCQEFDIHGVNFALWGNGWYENLADSSPLKKYVCGAAIYAQDMIKAFKCSKIVLNFVRAQNMSAHNMRTFEALASGAFLLTERTEEQQEAPFKEGENIECFGTHEELVKKIAFYLKNDTIRKNITRSGQAIVAQHFTLSAQLKTFFEYMNFRESPYESSKKAENCDTYDP